MAQVIDLIQDQDFEAFADDALADARRCAVAARLENRPEARRKTAAIIGANAALRAARELIYQDAELAAAIRRLKWRRAA